MKGEMGLDRPKSMREMTGVRESTKVLDKTKERMTGQWRSR
jgi:hypothetical protein